MMIEIGPNLTTDIQSVCVVVGIISFFILIGRR